MLSVDLIRKQAQQPQQQPTYKSTLRNDNQLSTATPSIMAEQQENPKDTIAADIINGSSSSASVSNGGGGVGSATINNNNSISSSSTIRSGGGNNNNNISGVNSSSDASAVARPLLDTSNVTQRNGHGQPLQQQQQQHQQVYSKPLLQNLSSIVQYVNSSGGNNTRGANSTNGSSASGNSNTTSTSSTMGNNSEHKKGTPYWCWLLKEYIRLGHAKSMNRVIKVLDNIEPYPFYCRDNIYNVDLMDRTSSTSGDGGDGVHDLFENDRYIYSFESKLVQPSGVRTSFPFIYIPNLLRQRSDLFQCFNKNFSFSNILYGLSTANIDSLLQAKFVPIPKSSPIVPFLLCIVYLKLCVSKGEGLRAIIDALADCKNKSHLMPSYDYPAIPLESLLNAMLLGHVRFIDWDINTGELLKTEVYFNELFEILYLTGREYLPAPPKQAGVNAPTPAQTSKLPTLTTPAEDYHFKAIDIYLHDSRKIVFYNIRYLSSRKGSFKPSIWSPYNLRVLLDCTLYHLDLYAEAKDNSTMQEILVVLEACLRLSLGWVTTVTGIHSEKPINSATTHQQQQQQSEIYWWTNNQDELDITVKLWIGVIERIMTEMTGQQAEKLLLIGLIWLGMTVSLCNDDPVDQAHEEASSSSYPLFIKFINKYPDMLSDINKSTLLIKSIGFAMTGVHTIEQTVELVNVMTSLWDNPLQQPNLPPSMDNACLVFKTIQMVFNSKFKPEHFPNQLAMENAIIDWTKVICDETNNSFYNSNQNSRYLSTFVGSAIIDTLQSSKCKFIPANFKDLMMEQIQEIFNTSINQINRMSKHQRIGIATSYCLSKIEPFKDKEACRDILKIILDTLLDEVLGINGCLNEWLEKPSDISNLVIKKIESHKSAPIFTALPSYVQTIITLILFLKDNDINKQLLLRLSDFSYTLNELWYHFTRDTTHAFPKASIQRTLTPTFTGIVRCLSFLFTDTAKVLTPIDSTMALEVFSQIGFIEDNIPIINLAIRSLADNIATSECAITRVVDKMPIHLTVQKDDPIACSKAVIYLNALERLITKVSRSAITDHIVPNLFAFMEYPNEKLNKLSHSILSQLFTIRDLELTMMLVPQYMDHALKSYPTYTKASSLFAVMVSIIENNSPTNPVVLYSTKLIIDSINDMMPQDKQKLSLSTPASTMVHLLFSLLQFIDVQILEIVLSDIRQILIKAPNFKIRSEICSNLLSEITGNLENSKKNICLSWYLRLIKEIEQSTTMFANNSGYDHLV
ncbi:hypothetical protein SAMD00019534_006400 [Acytostelium subglobosum LB1]|uniref:hypothetical protein n=1 Tax=Acytostelium subglobosum LB1 TaxID=1410327 RepID=UPI0006449E90|nr:hypothetical protein SAMD00019534_006400 [Acytostelium subglobosum LB1]GAM17465.1 hypothetical protein SAMD00019534_006400 [Acytostelium subglobosum LB1]|eukprot:XP_012759527.1 hypothetical protein SAMD00019534_006400 [Acytostelium subglobosum LB1]